MTCASSSYACRGAQACESVLVGVNHPLWHSPRYVLKVCCLEVCVDVYCIQKHAQLALPTAHLMGGVMCGYRTSTLRGYRKRSGADMFW